MDDNLDNNVASIAVIGLGLIGASILKSVQKYSPKTKRYGWSLGSELSFSTESGLINKSPTLRQAVSNTDLVIIATPISQILPVANEIYKIVKAETTVIEVASVKKDLIPIFEKLNKNNKGIEYVHTHPMGGSEKEGFNGSRTGIFFEKPWLVMHESHNHISETAKKRINWIIDVCGANYIELPIEKHDQLIANISHFILNISHLIFDFVVNEHYESLSLAGESFITTTRLASDNPKMIHEINMQNKENIDNLLNKFSDFIKSSNITAKDLSYFENNKQLRNRWLSHRRK